MLWAAFSGPLPGGGAQRGAFTKNVSWIISRLAGVGGDFYVECMKWNLLFSGVLAGSFLLASPLVAQESAAAAAEREEMEANFKRMNGRVEQLEETLQTQQKRMGALVEELHALRELVDRLKAKSEGTATQDAIKQLARKIEEVDEKRIADGELIRKNGRFLPKDVEAKYEVLKWVMFQMANVGPIVGNLFHFRRFAPPGSDYAFERFRNETRRLYGVIESRLSDSVYLGGPDFSIADIALHPWARLHEYSEVDLRELPSVARWLERCSMRPGLARAYEKTESFRAGFDETVRNTPPEHLDRIFGRKRREFGLPGGARQRL